MPPKSKKKGRKPAHQNEFAFRHNPKSKLTEKILNSPNVGLCRRCHEKIEWRKKYRKYKPLTQPAKCNLCHNRNVLTAYHTICGECVVGDKALVRVRDALGEVMNDVKESSGNEIDSHLVDGGTNTETSDTPQLEDDTTFKACAICVKEWALPESNDENPVEREIRKLRNEMEKKLGRPLKLRESKALVRKVETRHEREKQRLKEERRKAKWVDEVEESDTIENGPVSDDTNQEILSRHFSNAALNGKDDDEEEDEFIKATGGKGQLLTGQAYQEMLLRKENSINV